MLHRKRELHKSEVRHRDLFPDALTSSAEGRHSLHARRPYRADFVEGKELHAMEGSSASDERLLREAGLGHNTGSSNTGEVNSAPLLSRTAKHIAEAPYISIRVACINVPLRSMLDLEQVTVSVCVSWQV